MLGLLNATEPGSAIGGRSNPMVPSKRVTIHETEEGEDDTGSERSVQSDESDLFRGVEAPVDGIKSRTEATKLAKINGSKVQSNVISNVTKQLFASEAANNYYNIVNLNASKRKSFMNARKVNSATDSSTSFSEAGNKTLEQLVADALSVALTPEDMAHHALSQEHDGSDEKEALYSTTLLTTHEELNVASERSQNESIKTEIESIKTEIVSSLAVVPPVVPPIASFDVCRLQSNLSAASSITTEVALSEEKKVGVKSSIPGSDDPPMAEHPSPVCSPGENNIGYTADLPEKIELAYQLMLQRARLGTQMNAL
ncbi:hypothetical protein ACHAW5_011170 [Stephanodiscus triporus]|uniref:Uncharacterized protein n=1 Tax=Stephanodiscus triporus TaxID=2934178 RepID=A0ABD3MRJ6_9STRA